MAAHVLSCGGSYVNINEALPGVLGNGKKGHLFQGNKGLKIKGTGEQRQFWGTGNIGNQDLNFEEQGNKVIHFRGTGIPPGRAS